MIVFTLSLVTACKKEGVIQEKGTLVPKTVEHDLFQHHYYLFMLS